MAFRQSDEAQRSQSILSLVSINFSRNGGIPKRHKEEENHFPCDECGRVFNRSASLKNHRRSHVEKLFSCKACGKAFRSSGGLKSHMRTHLRTRIGADTQEKPFFCQECGKECQSYAHKSRINIHIVEKPFSCKECGEGFSWSGDLKNHMRIHTQEEPLTPTQEKPLFSKEYGKPIKTDGRLEKDVESQSRDKPFSCKECGRAFSHSYVLKIHMRIHTGEKPFSCKECGKAFSWSGELKNHMRSHTEKLFSCNECGNAFGSRGGLTSHMRTHIQEKPFFCKEYEKRYKTNGNNSDGKCSQNRSFERHVEFVEDLDPSVTVEEYKEEFKDCVALENQSEVQVKDEPHTLKEEAIFVADGIDIKLEDIPSFPSDVIVERNYLTE